MKCLDINCKGELEWKREMDFSTSERIAQCNKCKKLVLFSLKEQSLKKGDEK